MRRLCIFWAFAFLMMAAAAWAGISATRPSGPRHSPRRQARGRGVQASASGRMLLGDNSVESRIGREAAGSMEVFRFVGKTTGTATSITVYVASHSTAKALVAGLYSDKGRTPGSLLSSGSMSSPRARAWNTIRIGSTPVHSGRSYWVAVLPKRGRAFLRDRRNGACVGERSSVHHLAALPSRVSKARRLHACPISAYASGVPALGPVGGGQPGPPTKGPNAPSPGGDGPSEPANVTAPAIAGTARVGAMLSASTGSWTNTPTSYSYQWQDCSSSGGSCSNIDGATDSSYLLPSSDVGDRVDVVVTASNAGGSASATSAKTGVVQPPPQPLPVNTAAPTITGTAEVSDTLTASKGSWSNSPSSYAYQWRDCNSSGANCSSISGATGSKYKLASSDIGHTIEVAVTATNAGGSTAASSGPTALVPQPAPVNTSRPTIGGTAAVGDVLTASNGSWSNSPTGFSYAVGGLR